MKKSLILAGVLCIGYATAQTTDTYEERVGINTETPSATLNVKTKTNSKTPKNLELENQTGTKLVTVLNNGNVGIGTSSPISRLTIESNQNYPVTIKNSSYEYSAGAMNNSIVLKDKNDITYGYIGDASAHKRISLIGQKGYQVSLNSSHETTKDETSILFNSESTTDRVIIETVNSTGEIARTYINDSGNWRMGAVTSDNTSKLEVGGNIRSTNLVGTGNRNVYADENGVLKAGDAITTTTGATTLSGTKDLPCNDANRGKMNFVKDVTIGTGKGDAFAVCLKGTDGKFYWKYLYGAGGVTNLEGNFGAGL